MREQEAAQEAEGDKCDDHAGGGGNTAAGTISYTALPCLLPHTLKCPGAAVDHRAENRSLHDIQQNDRRDVDDIGQPV